MTREDIIRMGMEAGLYSGNPRTPGTENMIVRRLERFAVLVAAAEQPKHPGYIIGSHWLETAYSRICAGEAEADVLRDCGWERVDQALRRDAERYRWLKAKVEDYDGHACFPEVPYPAPIPDRSPFDAIDAAIDAAMGDKR